MIFFLLGVTYLLVQYKDKSFNKGYPFSLSLTITEIYISLSIQNSEREN